MIQEFENRLAVVLGGQLSSPFDDRVFVAGSEPNDTDPKILLGVVHHKPWIPEFSTSKAEKVPGQADFRRVLRQEVEVAFHIQHGQGEGRSQRRLGLDQLMFLLEQQDVADGSLLVEPGDQGFVIEDLKLDACALPLADSPETPSSVRAIAHGWFWPVGQAGAAGVAIAQTHIRAAQMKVRLAPEKPEIIAGGSAVNLTLKVDNTGFILEDGQAPQALGIDFLALQLRAAGGGPGLGTLQGDDQGADGIILVSVDNQGEASFAYTPPAQPGEDILHVAIAEGGVLPAEKHAGDTLTKFSLTVGTP